MRFTVLTNAQWANSGYANQVRMFIPRWQALGHEPAIIAFYGLQGAIMDAEVPVYPKAAHAYAQDITVAHTKHHEARLCISLIDAWVLDELRFQAPKDGIVWAAWAPVDHEPCPPKAASYMRDCPYPLVYSRWGTEQAQRAGAEHARYLPLAVDTKVMHPGDRAAARERVSLPEDRYVVTMVAANKCPLDRKAFAQQLEAFARFRARHSDALLYLHTSPHGGFEMGLLIKHLGIADAVLFADPYQSVIGYSDDWMADLYRGSDVLLAVSKAEGFGVPLLEAQACGTPVVAGDWTSMSELAAVGAVVEKQDADRWWTPQQSWWWVPRVGAIDEALEEVWRHGRTAEWEQAAVAHAAGYDANLVAATHWGPLLEEIGRVLDAPAPAAAPEVEVVSA